MGCQGKSLLFVGVSQPLMPSLGRGLSLYLSSSWQPLMCSLHPSSRPIAFQCSREISTSEIHPLKKAPREREIESLEAMSCLTNYFCNLCGQLQRCQMPDIENSRKNSRKGCRVGHGKTAEKQPEKHPKHPKNSQNGCFSGVFPAVFRLFYRDPLGTLFGCFSGCFQCRAFGTSVAGRRDCKITFISEVIFKTPPKIAFVWKM